MFKHFWSRLFGRGQKYDDNRMTPTGETLRDREWYIEHGILSPSDMALAHAIRDRLRQNKQEADQEGA